jgi:hypothetical protein
MIQSNQLQVQNSCGFEAQAQPARLGRYAEGSQKEMKEKLKWGASIGDPEGPDSRSGGAAMYLR